MSSPRIRPQGMNDADWTDMARHQKAFADALRGGPGRDQVEAWIEREHREGRVVEIPVVDGVPQLPGEGPVARRRKLRF